MRTRIRNYFIGKYLSSDDVFEKARATMLYQFTITFIIIFMLPLYSDFDNHLYKAGTLHVLDVLLLTTLPFVMKFSKRLDTAILIFFITSFLSNLFIFMMLNPDNLEPTAVLWSALFFTLAALLLKGITRMIFCGVLFWLPIFYVIININMHGALTITWLAEKKLPVTPPFILFIPIILLILAVLSHSQTTEEAKKTILVQKDIIELKNKEMTDSIVYAKRIQDSLLPNEKIMEKNVDRLKKN